MKTTTNTRQLSQETREKIAKALMGRRLSPEHRQSISIGMRVASKLKQRELQTA